MHLKVQLQVLAAEIQQRLCRDKSKMTWKGSLKSNGITKHTVLISVSCVDSSCHAIFFFLEHVTKHVSDSSKVKTVKDHIAFISATST